MATGVPGTPALVAEGVQPYCEEPLKQRTGHQYLGARQLTKVLTTPEADLCGTLTRESLHC